jgi:hypothetical protein
MDSSLMDVLYNLLHTAAVIQDESPADWHIVMAEEADGLFDAILVNFEILLFQGCNWPTFVVCDNDIERNQIDVQLHRLHDVVDALASRLGGKKFQTENV